MSFLQKLFYYCLLCGTAYLAFHYVYVGIFKNNSGENPYYMKQWYALASLFVLGILYKAYQTGEVQEKYLSGIWIVVSSWLMWLLVTLGFLILAKYQGRI